MMADNASFFAGGNLLGQGQWARRGEDDARLARLETNLATINTGSWTPWVPTLTQGVVVTKTVSAARYVRLGRTIHMTIDLSVTGAGTAATDVVIGLPVTALQTDVTFGQGHIYDASVGSLYSGIGDLQGPSPGGTFKLWSLLTALGHLGGVNFTAALAAGDLIRFSGTYEAAT